MASTVANPDTINLDGRDYLAYGFSDALDLASTLTTDADSLNVIASLRFVDLDHYTPDPFNDFDLGPNRDKGIDWAQSDFYLNDDDDCPTSRITDLAAILLKDNNAFVKAFGANLNVFAQKRMFLTTHQDARIVIRKDGATDFDDTDLNNINTWR